MAVCICYPFWEWFCIKKLAANRSFMVWMMIIFIADEILFWSNIWIQDATPLITRYPLHLCGTLSIIVPYLVLAKKYNTMRFFMYWSFGAGFISIVNPSYGHEHIFSYMFFHYHFRHYFLLLLPIFLQIGRGYKHEYRIFLKSVATLAAWAFVIFLFDWATGANYMHLGQSNETPIPFLPDSMVRWPVIYPTFVVVGTSILHLIYWGFSSMGRKCATPDLDILGSIDGSTGKTRSFA